MKKVVSSRAIKITRSIMSSPKWTELGELFSAKDTRMSFRVLRRVGRIVLERIMNDYERSGISIFLHFTPHLHQYTSRR